MVIYKIFFRLSLVLLAVNWISLHAQDLTITFVFTDAAGNVDSVVTGVAEDAREWYDADYDGIDLADTARTEGLDTRLLYLGFDADDLYVSKRNIMSYESLITLRITTENWPVTVEWNAVGNTDDARIANSVFTEQQPGFWGEESVEDDNVGFTPLGDSTGFKWSGSLAFNPSSHASEENGLTSYDFWIAFLAENPNAIPVVEASSEQLRVFPNPSGGAVVNVAGALRGRIRKAALFDALGREVRRYDRLPDRLPMAGLRPGWYVLRTQDERGRFWTTRLLRR